MSSSEILNPLNRATTLEFRVRYAETDAQGVAHHASYLVWLEEGRSEYLRQHGLFYSEMERSGYFVVVTGVSVQYKAPSFYEDVLHLLTTVEVKGGRILEFSYRLLKGESLLAVAVTKHLVLDPQRRVSRLSADVVSKIIGESKR